MTDQMSREIELLQGAYAAFNARNADAALVAMAWDVEWPRAFKGGFVHGHQAVREYWAEQWTEIDGRVEPVSFHPLGSGPFLVSVHQVVQDLVGTVLSDSRVGHRFTFDSGLIRRMEVCEPPADPAAWREIWQRTRSATKRSVSTEHHERRGGGGAPRPRKPPSWE